LSRIVADTVLEMLGPGTVLHAPLAAGGHVDHRLVRAAASSLVGRGAVVRFYEDFPYRLRPADHVGLRPAHSPVDMPGWLGAAACYGSQVMAMFRSAAEFRATLLSRAREHGRAASREYAERYWNQAHDLAGGSLRCQCIWK
jgi:hypothetical protein